MAKALPRGLSAPPKRGEEPQTCRRCDLWRHATQAVEGEGPVRARIMLVGEQPGDEEDLRGHPFIGPAGKVLDAALTSAKLDRRKVYVTNAVKHFKWKPRGKRRLHRRPDTNEIAACNVWLVREIERVKPRVIVALGATALRALLGRIQTIEFSRGRELNTAQGRPIVATYHPSAILRAEGPQAKRLRNSLVSDLRRAAHHV